MRKKFDEPLCPPADSTCTPDFIDAKKDISNLLNTESFAVLATQGEGQPYTSLMSFKVTEDLKKIVFSTPQETRKFELLKQSDKVALLVDNRSQTPPSLNRISAVTITGKANIIPPEKAQKWADFLMEKHPYQKSFIFAPSTALVVVDVYRYFLVKRFQEVVEWSPR